MTPERVIEVTIGLLDDSEVPPGKVPPVLAADIMAALTANGYAVTSEKRRCPICARATEQPEGEPCLVCKELGATAADVR